MLKKIYQFCQKRNKDWLLPKFEQSLSRMKEKQADGLVSERTIINNSTIERKSNLFTDINSIEYIVLNELFELFMQLFAFIKDDLSKNKLNYLFLDKLYDINMFFKDISIKISLVNLTTEPMLCITIIDLGERALL